MIRGSSHPGPQSRPLLLWHLSWSNGFLNETCKRGPLAANVKGPCQRNIASMYISKYFHGHEERREEEGETVFEFSWELGLWPLEEISFTTTICCGFPITTHGEKIQTSHFGCLVKVFGCIFGQLRTKILHFTTTLIYLCIFLPWVKTDDYNEQDLF